MSAPEAASSDSRLPVQHGWRVLSDGLHIHRWFLHCHDPSALPRHTSTYAAEVADEVRDLVERAELGYLFRLAAAHTPVEAAGAPVETADAPVEVAERLVVEAAARLLRRFIADASETRGGRPVDPDAAALAEHAMRIGAACRLLEALRADPVHAPVVEPRLQRYLSAAAQTRQELDGAVGSLPVIAEDLVTTFFPWPRRFAKYEAGGGAGQSE